MGRSKTKQKRLGTYGNGFPTLITTDILQSSAYRVLKPVEKLILADMLRAYCKASHWDSLPPPNGFIYTWSQCGEFVCERAFYAALKRICSVGFFSCPPAIQDRRPNQPKRYLQSTIWNVYAPTGSELQELEIATANKAGKVARDRKRRTDRLMRAAEKTTSTKVREVTSTKVREGSEVIPFPTSIKVREVGR